MSVAAPEEAANLHAMEVVLRCFYERPELVASEEMAAVLAADCVYEDWGRPSLAGARNIIQQALEPYASGFSDVRYEVDRTLLDGCDMVVCAEFRGRFSGSYAGLEPTGEEARISVRDLWTFRDGSVVRIAIASDTLATAKQLGGEYLDMT